MSKYQALGEFLSSRRASEVPMTFSDIERVTGAQLPPRAPNHPAWWSNNTSNNVMTKIWLDAGFRTERVDVSGRKLVFKRVDASGSVAGKLTNPVANSSGEVKITEPGLVERIRIRLAGTVTIPDGADITEPTGEIWNAER